MSGGWGRGWGYGLVEGYIAILLTENRVPGYPFYYPTGTRVQKYPKVRALDSMRSLSDASVTATVQMTFPMYLHFSQTLMTTCFSRISHNVTHVLKPLLPTQTQHS